MALLVAVCAVVVVSDQATKWLAWRHLDGTLINTGAYVLLSPAIRQWFADPETGAIANAIGFTVVAVGVAWLLWHRPSRWVVVGLGLVLAGYLSNLLDRVGLHKWTAPGSGRGVVDFIPSGGTSRGNVADLWIVLGLAILLGTLTLRARRRRPSR
jgi:lipoprotein signal peptidase